MKKNTHPVKLTLRLLILTALACVLPGLVFCQNTTADSLSRLTQRSRPDTGKVNLLTELGWELRQENPLRATTVLDSAIRLARQLNFKKGEGNALNFKGVVSDIHGEQALGIRFFQQALDIREQLGDRRGVASTLNNLGNVRENQGDYVAALDHYRRSLRIREEMQDSVRMGRSYYNISNLYERMGYYPEALDYIHLFLENADKAGDEESVAGGWTLVGNIKTETDRFEEALLNYQKALAAQRKLGNDWEVTTVLNNIANLKDAMAEPRIEAGAHPDSVLALFTEAIATHKEALALRQKMENLGGQAETYNNLGYVLKNVGSFHQKNKNQAAAEKTWLEAEKYLRLSLEIRQKEDDKVGIMEVFNGISDVRRRQKRYREALEYTERYYAIALEIDDQKFRQNGLKDFARIHNALGNYKTAYDYREQYDEFRYTRFNKERIQSEQRKDALFSDGKRQSLIDHQEQELKLQEAKLKTANTVLYSLLGGAALLLLLAWVLFNRNKIIRQEKQRSEDLLLNILPAQTAEELKLHGKAKARRYEAVTVLFTDFQSFTTIAEQIPPEELVQELDDCFRAFDEIVSQFGIEKIKTIGDAYLCVSGLPAPKGTHAEDAIRAALAMQAFMQEFRERQRQAGKPEFICRIGIHSGPVVAGVVGKKKFAYDIWGDTVNIAARMEQNGEAGKVNISQNSYELARDKFRFVHRGKVKAKNKGELDMYFVEMEDSPKKYLT